MRQRIFHYIQSLPICRFISILYKLLIAQLQFVLQYQLRNPIAGNAAKIGVKALPVVGAGGMILVGKGVGEALDFFLINNKSPEHQELIKMFLSIYHQLFDLKQLRNKTIIAHGFKSVGEKDFPPNFLNLIHSVGRLVGIDNCDASINLAAATFKDVCNPPPKLV